MDLYILAPGILAAALLAGHLLTRRVALLQRFLVPPSLTAGVLLLVAGPQVMGWLPQ